MIQSKSRISTRRLRLRTVNALIDKLNLERRGLLLLGDEEVRSSTQKNLSLGEQESLTKVLSDEKLFDRVMGDHYSYEHFQTLALRAYSYNKGFMRLPSMKK